MKKLISFFKNLLAKKEEQAIVEVPVAEEVKVVQERYNITENLILLLSKYKSGYNNPITYIESDAFIGDTNITYLDF
jgi:hypothetical protein